MKLLTVFLSTLLLSTNVLAASNTLSKGRWYTLPYDLTIGIKENPIDWARYERDVNKWRDNFTNSKDGKASTLKRMVAQSPGCVTTQGKGDHLQVHVLKYESRNTKGSFSGSAILGSKVMGFSDNSNANSDGKRKSSYDSIWMMCGIIENTAGSDCVDIYGVSLCLPF